MTSNPYRSYTQRHSLELLSLAVTRKLAFGRHGVGGFFSVEGVRGF